jgi:hypothetical protein
MYGPSARNTSSTVASLLFNPESAVGSKLFNSSGFAIIGKIVARSFENVGSLTA